MRRDARPWAANVCGVKQSGFGPDLLLDTGLSTSSKVCRDGNRIVTADTNRWLLWDASTAQEIARGVFEGVFIGVQRNQSSVRHRPARECDFASIVGY